MKLPSYSASECFSTLVYVVIMTLIPLITFPSCKAKKGESGEDNEPVVLLRDTVISDAENHMGLYFDEKEKELMAQDLANNTRRYEQLRSYTLDNNTPPAFRFDPAPVGPVFDKTQNQIDWMLPDDVQLPENRDDLAFYTVAELSQLIRNQRITSMELTRFYLDRLHLYGDTLHCVITLTEELAIQQAARADEEISQGKYRGPLHGIPYGVKDLFSVEGYKTTWGATPYKDQIIGETATVVKKLEEAGAVLVAKLSMGALAMGDVWYEDTTRNPWNLEQGSSGSSAGSASATAAGLVAFSIGTETLGSIVSPSTRCGTSGLRPTFGRVSRSGAMALSWTMDKIGPICRTAEDCALVFQAILGPDGVDQTLVDLPFNYDPSPDLSRLRVGYYKEAFENDYQNKDNDQRTLRVLKKMGIKLIPVTFPDSLPLSSMRIILNAEAAAAFDDLTRSSRDSLLVRQNRWAWPNLFRQARFIPAVEYIQANRLRYVLVQEMYQMMKEYDVIVTPSYGGNQLLITNLTGHPVVVIPNGFNDNGEPTSISFIGNLYDEATILAFARLYQLETNFEDSHPPLFKTSSQ
ncbi:MAG: amidase [Bacteroidales bacterium]|nr:MAG: amidase [Bacteroidales bacterium]